MIRGQLIGKAMWTCRRASDMAMFHVGSRRHVRTFKGEPAEIGEYALHVQCPWRIVRNDSIVVASGDLYTGGYLRQRIMDLKLWWRAFVAFVIANAFVVRMEQTFPNDAVDQNHP